MYTSNDKFTVKQDINAMCYFQDINPLKLCYMHYIKQTLLEFVIDFYQKDAQFPSHSRTKVVLKGHLHNKHFPQKKKITIINRHCFLSHSCSNPLTKAIHKIQRKKKKLQRLVSIGNHSVV